MKFSRIIGGQNFSGNINIGFLHVNAIFVITIASSAFVEFHIGVGRIITSVLDASAAGANSVRIVVGTAGSVFYGLTHSDVY